MALLNIYKASAGSGKTWRLTVEYVTYLLKQPDAYKNTLAVTFTNKATAEMKERILNALWMLSRLDPNTPATGMTATLVQETGMDLPTLKKNAGLSLHLLLHDYSRFRVETIDSFFQSILRNLARELGVGTGLNIELNNASVLSEAVDYLLDHSNEDPILLNWITDFMEESYRDGKVLRIDRTLKTFGMNIFKENYKEKATHLEEQLKDKTFLQHFKKDLQTLQRQQENRLKQSAERFFKVLETNNLNVEDFSNKESGVAGYFIKLTSGICSREKVLGIRVQNAMSEPDAWVTRKHPRQKEIAQLASLSLMPLLLETEALREQLAEDILTCRICIKHLSSIGLLSDISRQVTALNQAANRFLLSNTNDLLSQFISGQDTSFVFEKTGTEIHHILFDEFQDTSRLQWETFKPILAESLANGNRNLVVGDEKQAIYRWRNGDWRILGTMKERLSASTVAVMPLTQNWRSDATVVDFNNKVFNRLIEIAASHLETNLSIPAAAIRQAYLSVEQQAVHTELAGYVNLQFLSADDSTDYTDKLLTALLHQTEQLQLQGIKAEDIAILVRHNKHIPTIATWFSAHRDETLKQQGVSYDIISDEAFLLAASGTLQLLVTALRLLTDPEDPLLEAQLTVDYQRDVLKKETTLHDLLNTPANSLLPESFVAQKATLGQLPLHELVETLYQQFGLHQLEGQDSYLYSFMDKVTDYLGHHPSDLPSFLEYWDESLASVSVSAGTGIKGIRILSIHKAKGLEFHTVFVPFCDWKLLGERPPQLWCNPNKAPFNRLPLIPVDYSSSLPETIFKDDYQQETLELFLDNINLLYVAFTRAKSNLIVLGKGKKTSSKPATTNKLTTVSDLLLETLTDTYNPETGSITFGTLETTFDTSEQKTATSLVPKGTDIPVAFISYGHNTHFRQSTRSKAFSQGWETAEYHNPYIDRGKLYHRLFSAIKTHRDAEKAVNELVFEGLIKQDAVADCLVYVQRALSHPLATDWFSGRYKLFNECSILLQDAEGHALLKRPDRVMLNADQLTIVDFKFGKPNPQHHRQVQEYMQLLVAMGYPNTTGYLWYVDAETVEPVAR